MRVRVWCVCTCMCVGMLCVLSASRHVIPHAREGVFGVCVHVHVRGHAVCVLSAIFWLAKTSNKPISLTIWLAVNPFKLKLKLKCKQACDTAGADYCVDGCA